jgi:exodeoxyribonuclease VII small subunit
MELEKSFDRLEEIIAKMSNAHLDEALSMYKEGISIIENAKKSLDEARAEFIKANGEEKT